MLRTTVRVLLVAAALTILAPDASAFGGRHGWGAGGYGWGGGWGGGCWGGGYGGCGYGGCGYAGLGYGGYGGWGYGGYGSWRHGVWHGRGINYGGWGYGGPYGAVGYGVPLASTAGPGGTRAASLVPAPDAALLAIECPADAKVYVNDRPTVIGGTRRTFVSRNLVPGATYNYHVRVQYERDGQVVDVEKTVPLAANKSAQLSINDSGELVASGDKPSEIAAPDSSPPSDKLVAQPAPDNASR